MLRFQDRLYGRLELPDLAWELATTCPVILRLREIRMANIPFFTYPSFANVDRYEHSLGVAHLAWRWARANCLPEDLGIALTIAALYHDGATPAYGHLFEEFLGRFGFDHETTLVEVLLGKVKDLPGREHVQVFLGRECRLRSVLPRPRHSMSSLTLLTIVDLLTGEGPLGLGRLVKGDIDFDNIDNVIRAASAMGLVESEELVHPYAVVDAIRLECGGLRIKRGNELAIQSWAETRRLLYDSILNNAHEFRAQTAIKWAIEELVKADPALASERSWRLTDPVLTFECLRGVAFSRLLVDRVRLGRPPDLLFSAWIDDLTPVLGKGSDRTLRYLCDELERLTNTNVYVNFYLDKRERTIRIALSENHTLFDGIGSECIRSKPSSTRGTPGGLLGAIILSHAERVGCEDRSDIPKLSSRRAINLDRLAALLESVFKVCPRALSFGWVGTRRAAHRKLPLAQGAER